MGNGLYNDNKYFLIQRIFCYKKQKIMGNGLYNDKYSAIILVLPDDNGNLD